MIPTPGELAILNSAASEKAAEEATKHIECSLENSMNNYDGPNPEGYYTLDTNTCEAIHRFRAIGKSHNEKFDFDHSFFIGIRSILNKRGWDIEKVKQHKKTYLLKLRAGVELSAAPPKPDVVATQKLLAYIELLENRLHCAIRSLQFEPGTIAVDLHDDAEEHELRKKLNGLRKARWDALFEESLQDMKSLAGLDKPEEPLKTLDSSETPSD